MADAGHEPSMEEILSSIKRIIAEDSDAALSGPRVKRAVAPAASDVSDNDVLELTDPVDAPPPLFQPPSPPPPRAKAPVVPPVEKPALVSSTTADASRSSLAALSALIVKPEVVGGDTLEGLVREMLKPMLADWLDARLPDIVERLVATEIRRIAERS